MSAPLKQTGAAVRWEGAVLKERSGWWQSQQQQTRPRRCGCRACRGHGCVDLGIAHCEVLLAARDVVIHHVPLTFTGAGCTCRRASASQWSRQTKKSRQSWFLRVPTDRRCARINKHRNGNVAAPEMGSIRCWMCQRQPKRINVQYTHTCVTFM